MLHSTIFLRVLGEKALPVALLFLSIHCFAGDPLNKEAQENADHFFEYIINGDFDSAYKYTSGSIRYRSKGMAGNANITGKKDFIDKSGKLFNKPFRDVLRNANNLIVECCLSSRYVWEENGVYIWFHDNGTPDVIVNPYMIEPSYNCSKARTEVEKAICRSLPLANQDQELKNTFDEAKIMLTGQDYKKLKSTQISFIKNRESCGSDEACIIRDTERRIRRLEKLTETEREKPAPEPGNGLADLNGMWRSVHYKSSSYCGGESDEEIAAKEEVEVYINYPSMLKTIENIEGKSIRQECKVNKVRIDTFAKVYFRTVYSNNYWGSCGGDIFNLPYAGRYILLELSSVTMPERDCGVIVLTGHEDEPATLIYGDYLLDEVLLGSGHVLEKAN